MYNFLARMQRHAPVGVPMFFFEPQAIAYSSINAVGLAQAARLAYLNPSDMAATVRLWSFPRFQFLERNQTQAFIMGNDEVIILAFRGTECRCLKDWMTNANVALIPESGGRVHRGFSMGLDIIWSDILMNIQNFCTNKQPIFVTGHSLGGALATLAAAKLQIFGYPVQGIYTFGSPRVGDMDFFNHFSRVFPSTAFRFVNNNDIVTRVAPRSFGYKHVGQCLFFDNDGMLHPEIDAWNKFLDNVKGGMDKFFNDCGIIIDHDMAQYEDNVVFNMRELYRTVDETEAIATSLEVQNMAA
jgi:triacylglycerol lipase